MYRSYADTGGNVNEESKLLNFINLGTVKIYAQISLHPLIK